MDRPDIFYALALALALSIEAMSAARGKSAFGGVLWVIGAVFSLSYAAFFMGVSLPHAQFLFHCFALLIGMMVARDAVGVISAGMFFPMAGIGALCLFGIINTYQWWWALFYVACAQLAILGASANLHPLGRGLRKWSSVVYHRFERRAWQ